MKGQRLQPKELHLIDSCDVPSGTPHLEATEASELAAVFSALADPIRLQILSIIEAEGEVCACHLEGPLARSQSTISHHTTKLAEAGLIEGERRGRWVHWRIASDHLRAVSELLGRFAQRSHV